MKEIHVPLEKPGEEIITEEIKSQDETVVSQGNDTLWTFNCPICRKYQLAEVINGKWTTTVIEGVLDDGEIIYGHDGMDGGGNRTFQCDHCGYEPSMEQDGGPTLDEEDFDDDDIELIRWFKAHGTQTKLLTFTCPECGGHKLAMIRTGHTTIVPIVLVYDKQKGNDGPGVVEEYMPEHRGGNLYYGCEDCGHSLRDKDDEPISDKRQMVRWLKKTQ